MRITNSNIEYLEHGLNWSKYCPNCTFCYMLFRRKTVRPSISEDKEYQIRHELGELKNQLKKGFIPKGDIMMSTSHDPFAKHCKRTGIAALDLLCRYPKVTSRLRVLSKNLSRVIPAATIEAIPKNALYGATITTLDIIQHETYCPGGDPPLKQIEALKNLNALGYRTWLSLEPCFSEMNIVKILQMVPFVERIAIGKHNRVAGDKNHYELLNREQFKRQIDLAIHAFPGVNILVKRELDKWLLKRKKQRKGKRK